VGTSSYRISFALKAARQLAKLPRTVQQRIRPRIDALATNPRPRGVVKLAGADGVYRLRVGDHRVIYQVEDDALLVLVLKIGHAATFTKEG
jgi:mRNA interferase RelE/StbE